jgi:transcription elongation factor GreA
VVEMNGVEKSYTILGSSETEPGKGIISHNSPMGAALIGRTIGDKVTVLIGKKEVEYSIISKKRP